jgi:8-oxo-dGTP pyrophosphatase MutT (NUDIX family)
MNRFNIRVYGVLKNIQNEILVTDELIRGSEYTKFPGGGLEFGEGTRDCLKREFIEEMNLAVEVGDHLYTTDFFPDVSIQPGAPDYIHLLLGKGPGRYHSAAQHTAFSFRRGATANVPATERIEKLPFYSLSGIDRRKRILPIDNVVAGTSRMVAVKPPASKPASYSCARGTARGSARSSHAPGK